MCKDGSALGKTLQGSECEVVAKLLFVTHMAQNGFEHKNSDPLPDQILLQDSFFTVLYSKSLEDSLFSSMCKHSMGRHNNVSTQTWSLLALWSPSLTAVKEGQCLSSGFWFGLISSGWTVQCQHVSVQHHENKNIKIWCCDSPRGSHQWLCLLQLKVLISHGLTFVLCSYLPRFEMCRSSSLQTSSDLY